LVRAQLL